MKNLYQNVTIPATSGKKTFAKSGWSYVDSDFENWKLNKKGPKTEEATLTVLEMDKDGTLQEIFSSINPDMDSMTLTQEQIISFCENHKDKLRDNWYGNLFLFKVGTEFFVADVYVYGDGGLRAGVRRLSYDYVWHAGYRHRIVVPQLALKNFTPAPLVTSDTLTLALGKLDAALEIIKNVQTMLKK